MTSSNCFFCSTNSVKLKDSLFTVEMTKKSSNQLDGLLQLSCSTFCSIKLLLPADGLYSQTQTSEPQVFLHMLTFTH